MDGEDDDMGFVDDDEEQQGADEDEEGPTAENEYYNAKGMVEDSIKEALKCFRNVVDLEKDNGAKGEWFLFLLLFFHFFAQGIQSS